MKLKIDGVEVDVVRTESCRDGTTWRRVFVKPKGEPGGPRAQHTVPQLHGAFRTGGHRYEFFT